MKLLQSGKSRSGAVAVGGVAQDVASDNLDRFRLTFQNTSPVEMRLTEDGTTASASNGYKLSPGDTAEIGTNRRVSLFCAMAGATYASTEF